MSTRSITLIEKHPILIYRHSDGQPEGKFGVLATLVPTARDLVKYRGFFDQVYLTAQITAAYVNDVHQDIDKLMEQYKERGEDPEKLRHLRYLGIGVRPRNQINQHSDVDYIYNVRKDRVDVYQPGDVFESRFFTLKKCEFHSTAMYADYTPDVE